MGAPKDPEKRAEWILKNRETLKRIREDPELLKTRVESQKKTYNEHPEKREEKSKQSKKMWKKPGYRENVINKMKMAQEKPENREKKSKATTLSWQDAESREKRMKTLTDPKYREKMSAIKKASPSTQVQIQALAEFNRGKHITPEQRGEKQKIQPAISKKNWEDPEYRRKTLKGIKNREKKPDVIQKKSRATKKSWEDPEVRKKREERISKKAKERYEDPAYYIHIYNLWYGAVADESYCELYDADFKDRCRGSYGYVCFLCGTPMNGNRFPTHHVDWNKKTCCDGSRRYIIPLCSSCHSIVRGNKKKPWSEWRNELVKMIESYYGHWAAEGRSFLTVEEWNAIKDAPFIPPETRYTTSYIFSDLPLAS